MASAKEPRSQVVDFTTPDAFESVLVNVDTLKSGEEIQLNKNRKLIDNVLITIENGNIKKEIPLKSISSVDMYAA